MSHSGHGDDGHGHGHGDGKGHAAHADLEQPLLKEDHGHSHGGGDAGHAAHGGGDDHGHSHGGGGCSGHGHGAATSDDLENIRALQKAIYLASFFMLVELLGGYFANSLAIMTDAAHMLSDVGGFCMSLLGMNLAAKAATAEYTYGFKNAEVLGAFFSILVVWALTAVLLFQAVERFRNPESINAPVMLTISVIGLVVNLVLMKVLGHNHSHSHGGGSCGGDAENIAIKAAVAHVVGDIVQSLGVCAAALLIWLQPFDVGYTDTGVTKWVYADPCCTVLFGIMVLWTTKATMDYAIDTMMVKAPQNFDQDDFKQALEKIPNVVDVHDLHVWGMGSKEVLCTAHVMVKGASNQTGVLNSCIKVGRTKGITHSTFQLEIDGEFDPMTETFGGLGCASGASLGGGGAKKDDGHGHGHAHGEKKKDDGHAHDGGGGCCGGHDNGGGDSHGHGGHGGHGGHSDHGH